MEGYICFLLLIVSCWKCECDLGKITKNHHIFIFCRFSDMWANSPFSYEAERERIEKIRAERGRRRPPSPPKRYQSDKYKKVSPQKRYQTYKVSKSITSKYRLSLSLLKILWKQSNKSWVWWRAGTYLNVVLQEPTICQFLKIDLLLQERIDVLLPDKREVCAFQTPSSHSYSITMRVHQSRRKSQKVFSETTPYDSEKSFL